MQIIAGEYKRRKLLSPRGRATTRPITGSVKKSLFGMLGERLDGAVVVDLFCGTGTLGLEALSRGAGLCFFAERDREALRRLKRNIETLDTAARCIIWSGDVLSGLEAKLSRLGRAVDVAFVDPPYAQSRGWSWQQAGERIFGPLAESLAEDGTVVFRSEASVEPPDCIAGLAVRRVRKYGNMMLLLLGREREGR